MPSMSAGPLSLEPLFATKGVTEAIGVIVVVWSQAELDACLRWWQAMLLGVWHPCIRLCEDIFVCSAFCSYCVSPHIHFDVVFSSPRCCPHVCDTFERRCC